MTTQQTRWTLPVCPRCKRHIRRLHSRDAWYNCPVHGMVSMPLMIEVVEATDPSYSEPREQGYPAMTNPPTDV